MSLSALSVCVYMCVFVYTCAHNLYRDLITGTHGAGITAKNMASLVSKFKFVSGTGEVSVMGWSVHCVMGWSVHCVMGWSVHCVMGWRG